MQAKFEPLGRRSKPGIFVHRLSMMWWLLTVYVIGVYSGLSWRGWNKLPASKVKRPRMQNPTRRKTKWTPLHVKNDLTSPQIYRQSQTHTQPYAKVSYKCCDLWLDSLVAYPIGSFVERAAAPHNSLARPQRNTGSLDCLSSPINKSWCESWQTIEYQYCSLVDF